MTFEDSVDKDPNTAWAEARAAMQALLDDPQRASLEYDRYFGRTTLQKTIDGFLSLDLLIHGWDIARATGKTRRCRPTRSAGCIRTP